MLHNILNKPQFLLPLFPYIGFLAQIPPPEKCKKAKSGHTMDHIVSMAVPHHTESADIIVKLDKEWEKGILDCPPSVHFPNTSMAL